MNDILNRSGYVQRVSSKPCETAVFQAVSLVRVALRRQDSQPAELARAAGLLLGLEDTDAIRQLATQAEDGCRAARRVLRYG